ncbi:hypothetical protein EDD22DRAFT_1005707 [Suillus occidentalis]|nr:hypothetical protein EDD22DRAFT_1005707 [Suillus occidentalis]
MVQTIRRTTQLVDLTNLRPADAYPKHHSRLHSNDGINGPAPSAWVNDLRHRSPSSSDYIPNYHPDTDPKLGRAGSTTPPLVADYLGRNVSVTATATSYTDTDVVQLLKLGQRYSAGKCPMDSGSGGFQGGSMDSLVRARPSVYSGTPGHPLGDQEEENDDEYFHSESDDPDPDRFVNFSLLSHLAVRLRDKVPRGTHVKSSIPYRRAFTGKDIVRAGFSSILALPAPAEHNGSEATNATLNGEAVFSVQTTFMCMSLRFSPPVRSKHFRDTLAPSSPFRTPSVPSLSITSSLRASHLARPEAADREEWVRRAHTALDARAFARLPR